MLDNNQKMKRVSLKTQIGQMPDHNKKIKVLIGILVFILSYRILISQNSEQIQEKENPQLSLPSKTQQKTNEQETSFHLVSNLQAPQQVQHNSDQAIQWLIDISKKQDSQLSVQLAKERKDLLARISQQNKDNGIDLDVLFRKNQIYQMLDLDCLKHKKFTSPAQSNTGLLGLIFSLFIRDPYRGLQAIFQNKNTQYWRSAGNRITVFSGTNISPYYVKLLMHPQADNQRVALFGLRIQQDKLAVMKTFSNYYLGSYDLGECDRDQRGMRYLTCTLPNCNGYYTFIMLIMEKVAIAELQVYGQRS